jgi:hypothetical protein
LDILTRVVERLKVDVRHPQAAIIAACNAKSTNDPDPMSEHTEQTREGNGPPSEAVALGDDIQVSDWAEFFASVPFDFDPLWGFNVNLD